MKIDFDVPIKFKDQIVEGQTFQPVLFQTLSQYGGLTGELKAAISSIIGDLARADGEVELSKKDLEHLQNAWNQACEDDSARIPLMYDEAVDEFLQDKIEGGGDGDNSG